jgi:hypothetical protein
MKSKPSPLVFQLFLAKDKVTNSLCPLLRGR